MDELDNSWALTVSVPASRSAHTFLIGSSFSPCRWQSAGQKRTYYFSGERNDLKGQGHQTSGTGVAPEQPAMRYIDRNKSTQVKQYI